MGTRGSALALAQSSLAARALETLHPELTVETVVIKTTGDLFGAPPPEIAKTLPQGAKGLWVKELEEALLDFGGCAVVISHDRWFLDRIATHILAFEGDSETVWFEGNYQAYIEDLKKRKGPDADQPHRIKYKKLVRT